MNQSSGSRPRAAAPARWRQHWRAGLPVVFYRGLQKALRGLGLVPHVAFSIHHLLSVPTWRLVLPARLPRDLRVEEVGREAVDELEALRQGSRLAFLGRFESHHRCLAAFLDAGAARGAARRRCVAFVWVVPGPARIPSLFGCVWQIPAGTLWLYDLYSDPNMLGALAHFNASLRASPLSGGAAPVLAGQIETDNHRSRQAHRSLGYREHATIYSFRLGRFLGHWSWRRHPRRLHWYRGRAVMPLHFLNPPPPLPPTTPHAHGPLKLRCRHCGRAVALEENLTCPCGAAIAARREEVMVVDESTPYWGEVPHGLMAEVVRRAPTLGWRQAVRELVPAHLHDYIMGEARADFSDVLPLAPGARVLDLGAGWGAIAGPLARHYRVVALEGVAERAQFMGVRKRQEKLENLTILHCPIKNAPLDLGQFDAIVCNGVLEWTALGDPSLPPRLCQLEALLHWRSLLAPGGLLYVGIENRCGWSELRGAADHSGLPYTSLLPRFLARWVCARSRTFRSQFNVGYRTYTYTYRGYRKLFRQAGFQLRQAWISPRGYNQPSELVPLHRNAIRFAMARRPAAPGARGWLRGHIRRTLGQAWLWRWCGSDFVFLLEPAPVAPADANWKPRAGPGGALASPAGGWSPAGQPVAPESRHA